MNKAELVNELMNLCAKLRNDPNIESLAVSGILHALVATALLNKDSEMLVYLNPFIQLTKGFALAEKERLEKLAGKDIPNASTDFFDKNSIIH